MRIVDFLAAGLTREEAETYALLLRDGAQTAGSLLHGLKLKRGTLYQVLRGLKAKGLVSESGEHKTLLFSPESPDRLLDRVREKKDEVARAEASVMSALPELKTAYLAASQKPIFRFYEGIEGLKAIYESQIETAKEIWFLRAVEARAYEKHFGKWWAHFIRRRKERGIVTHGLTPDTPGANHDPAVDKAWGVVRTWIRPEDYASPVEIDVYGDTVAIISYGKEIFGLTMENPMIAGALLEILKLAKAGAESRSSKR